MNTFLKRERNISLIVDRYFIIDYPKSLEQQIIIKLDRQELRDFINNKKEKILNG